MACSSPTLRAKRVFNLPSCGYFKKKRIEAGNMLYIFNQLGGLSLLNIGFQGSLEELDGRKADAPIRALEHFFVHRLRHLRRFLGIHLHERDENKSMWLKSRPCSGIEKCVN